MRIVAIDFEASCLPRHGRSFPIEVGIADDSGSARSWLIRPHADWAGWDWTAEAESLHGISREQLEREGLPVETVAAELATALHGRRAIADSWLDDVWMQTLAAAARVSAPARVGHVEEVIDALHAPMDAVVAVLREIETRDFAWHRAGDDARRLMAFIEALHALPASRTADGPLFPWTSEFAAADGGRPVPARA